MPPKRIQVVFIAVSIAIVAFAIVILLLRSEPDASLLEPLIREYGYAVLIAMTTLGNLGLPVPEETTALIAGIAARKGWLAYPWVWLICVLSAVIGDCLGYWIGRTGGRRLLLRVGPYVGVNARRLTEFERFFERHGAKTVFFARFVTGLRFAAGPLSGAARMPFRRFALGNVLGALAWVTLITRLGYHFGLAVLNWISEAGWVSLIAVVALIAVAWWIHRYRRQTKPD
jgi:membrane protein DedA with SNARE-associated domain